MCLVPIINSWIVKLLLSRGTNRGVLDLLVDLTPLRRFARMGEKVRGKEQENLRNREAKRSAKKKKLGPEGPKYGPAGKWCMNELTFCYRSTLLPNNFQLSSINPIQTPSTVNWRSRSLIADRRSRFFPIHGFSAAVWRIAKIYAGNI